MTILEDAVSGMPWARSSIDRLHSDIKSFKDFYGALSNSLQKYVKESRETPVSGNEIHFQQPLYASRSPHTSQQFNSRKQVYNYGNGNTPRFHQKMDMEIVMITGHHFIVLDFNSNTSNLS